MDIRSTTGTNTYLCTLPIIVLQLLCVVQVGAAGSSWTPTCKEEHMPVLGRNEYGEWIIRPDAEYFFQEHNGDQTLLSDMHGEIYPHS